ncbi:CPA_1a_G0000900.mRNA.1.CDS.1 [Saccharomyces cerevisiae]|nr:CPA_1a_G0000900.mRNA.1.CDS.1 [Saccharomyces cerevisiae]CAI7129666.1 CPA_1a_G0000900.mRNA.1.CDS.1 [Saccharomyces cerevisiae]
MLAESCNPSIFTTYVRTSLTQEDLDFDKNNMAPVHINNYSIESHQRSRWCMAAGGAFQQGYNNLRLKRSRHFTD